MTLDTLIIFAGAFVAALPFLGFPSSWDTVLLFLLGIGIIGLGIALRRRDARPETTNHEALKEQTESPMEHDAI